MNSLLWGTHALNFQSLISVWEKTEVIRYPPLSFFFFLSLLFTLTLYSANHLQKKKRPNDTTKLNKTKATKQKPKTNITQRCEINIDIIRNILFVYSLKQPFCIPTMINDFRGGYVIGRHGVKSICAYS